MHSRSRPELATLALGAAVDGVWCGALAAALTSSPWVALTVFAAVVVLAGALVARRLDGGRGDGDGSAGSGGRERAGRERRARVLALALILGATAALLAAGRSWAHPSLLLQVARDFVYAVGLVLVGLYLGRATTAPDVAVRRAVRAFAMLCLILGTAAAAGASPAWAPWAVVTSLVAGGLLVALVRHRDLADLVQPDERMPAWPWMLAVAGAVIVVVVAGALLSQALRVDAVLWLLHALAGGFRYALAGVAFALGYAGAALMRAVSWVVGLVHLHPWRARWEPPLAPKPPVIAPLHAASPFRFPSAAKLAGTIVGAVAVIGLAVTLVVLALRRLRSRPEAELLVVEEREAVGSLRSAMGSAAGRFVRRIRGRFAGLGRRGPLRPEELVRRRYAELERGLARAGQPRGPGVTVRDHLRAVTTSAARDQAPDRTARMDSAPRRSAEVAGGLASIYERARYSPHEVDVAEARRFEALSRAFEG